MKVFKTHIEHTFKDVLRRDRHNSRFGWLPVTTGYQNFGLRVVTGYHWLLEFRSRIGNRLPLVTKFDDLDRLSSVTNFLTEADVPT